MEIVFYMLVVTARARRDLLVADAVGPSAAFGPRWVLDSGS